ncbi:MAG: hypothetical protein AAF747_01830 [Planctomycetota bacterium]
MPPTKEATDQPNDQANNQPSDQPGDRPSDRPDAKAAKADKKPVAKPAPKPAEPVAAGTPALPRPLALALAAVLGISALAGSVITFQAATNEVPAWSAAAFGVIVVLSGVIGAVAAASGLRQGPGVALLTVGGCALVAAAVARFSWFATVLTDVSVRGSVRALGTDPLFLIVAAASLVTLAMAVGVVLRGSVAAWRMLVLGSIAAGASLGVAGFAVLRYGRELVAPVETLGDAIRVFLVVIGAIVVGVVFSVGVHTVISAFERGSADSGRGEPSDASNPKQVKTLVKKPNAKPATKPT